MEITREEYNRRQREEYKGITLRLHKERDAELIAWLEDKRLKKYITDLIIKDMERKSHDNS